MPWGNLAPCCGRYSRFVWKREVVVDGDWVVAPAGSARPIERFLGRPPRWLVQMYRDMGVASARLFAEVHINPRVRVAMRRRGVTDTQIAPYLAQLDGVARSGPMWQWIPLAAVVETLTRIPRRFWQGMIDTLRKDVEEIPSALWHMLVAWGGWPRKLDAWAYPALRPVRFRVLSAHTRRRLLAAPPALRLRLWAMINSVPVEQQVRWASLPFEDLRLPIGDFMTKYAKQIPVRTAWHTLFGRVPSCWYLNRLTTGLVVGLYRTQHFKFLLRAWRSGLRESVAESSYSDSIVIRNIQAIARVFVWFGQRVMDRAMEYLDVGYYLPDLPPAPEMVDVAWKHRRRLAEDPEIAGVFVHWREVVSTLGRVDLIKSARDLKCAKTYVRVLTWYKSVQHLPLAMEAAKAGVGGCEYPRLEERWLQGVAAIDKELLPDVSVTRGIWTLRLLDRQDPRGLFLGHYTGCCQHPEGAGATAAWHGATDPQGRFLVLFKEDEIKLQSWVWLQDRTLILDNIEGLIAEDNKDLARSMYMDWARLMVKEAGVQEVLVGVGNSDLDFPDARIIDNPYHAPAYTDARRVWVLIEEEEGHDPLCNA